MQLKKALSWCVKNCEGIWWVKEFALLGWTSHMTKLFLARSRVSGAGIEQFWTKGKSHKHCRGALKGEEKVCPISLAASCLTQLNIWEKLWWSSTALPLSRTHHTLAFFPLWSRQHYFLTALGLTSTEPFRDECKAPPVRTQSLKCLLWNSLKDTGAPKG